MGGAWSANQFSYKPQKTTQGTTDYSAFNTSQDLIDAWLAKIVRVDNPKFGADSTGVIDATTAVQAAVDSITNGVVLFPPGTFKMNGAVTVKEGITVQGAGIGSTFITNNTSNYTFKYTTANGTTERNAPKFIGFTLTADYGIQLNDPDNKFTTDNTSQEYMMRPYIADVNFIPNTGAIGTAILWNKCFDGVIERSRVGNFDKGIVFHGCDICDIRDSRIIGCKTYQIGFNPDPVTYTYNGFGSQTLVQHNDLLALNDGGTAVIYSGDFHPIIKNNYFEQTTGTIESIVKVIGGYSTRFVDNRTEVPAARTSVGMVDFSTLAANSLPALIEIYGNYTQGNPTAGIAWPAAGVPYYITNSVRRSVVHRGNIQAVSDSMPFNSQPATSYQGKTAFMMTADLPGIDPTDYAIPTPGTGPVVVQSGAIILPPVAAFGSLIQGTSHAGGTFDFYIEAKGGVAGQAVKVQVMDGAVIIGTYTQALTTSYAWYTLASSVAIADLVVQIWNDDTANNTNVSLKRFQADYH